MWRAVARFLGVLVCVIAIAYLVAALFSNAGIWILWGTKPLIEITLLGIIAGISSRVASLNWASSMVLFVASGVGCTMLAFDISSDSPGRGDVLGNFQWGLVLGMPIHLVLGTVARIASTGLSRNP